MKAEVLPNADGPLLEANQVVALRVGIGRDADLSLDRPQDLLRESERLGGRLVSSATAFLTGAECPFRCVYCDLWRHTVPGRTPAGAIASQVEWSIAQLRDAAGRPEVHTLKLYNASNFFDERAVPSADDDAILAALDGFERVVVECHPRILLGRGGAERASRYAEESAGLEIALGLETAAPGGLERLGKGATLVDFAQAFEKATRLGATIRAFVLHGIPGGSDHDLHPDRQRQWTLETVRWARERGASLVSIIPVRGGNGAMERLAARGLWRRPTLAELLAVAEEAVALEAPDFEVLVDCWDLEALQDAGAPGDTAQERRIERLRALDREGSGLLRVERGGGRDT